MARKIQFKRGLKANLPKLSPAELAFTTDEKKAYIGDGNENIRLLDQKDKTEITTQLAEKAKQSDVISLQNELPKKVEKSYLDQQLSNIGSASPKGTYATLTALQTAFPTGTTGIYVVAADGKWYFWNGTTWTPGGQYQSTGVASDSITPKELSADLRQEVSSLLKNLCVNGSFEDGLNSWIPGGNVTPTLDNTLSHHGTNSINITTSAQSGVLRQDITIPDNHKVYVSAGIYLKSLTQGGNILEICDKGTYNVKSILTSQYTFNAWQKRSLIMNVGSGISGIRIVAGSTANSTRNINLDSIMVIDLTETFGAGKEPSVEEMDLLLSNIGLNWFQSTSLMSKMDMIKKIQSMDKNVNQSIGNVQDVVQRSVLARKPLIKQHYARSGGLKPQFWHNGELYIISASDIRKTTDFGATTSKLYDFTSEGVQISNLLRLEDGSWLAIIMKTGNNYEMRRSTDLQNWTIVQELGVNTSGPMIGNQGWATHGSTVLYGEYTTDDRNVKKELNLWVSSDYGQTWKKGKTWSRAEGEGIRHIHCVQWDKHSNKFWVATGDNIISSNECFIFSTTDGVNLTTEFNNTLEKGGSAVQLAFNKNYVIWGNDTQANADYTINVMNRKTKEIVKTGYLNEMVYNILNHPRGYLIFEQGEGEGHAVYTPSIFVYWSEDGFSWERLYEFPLNEGDRRMMYNLLLSPDGKYLTMYVEYTPKGNSKQFILETYKLDFALN